MSLLLARLNQSVSSTVEVVAIGTGIAEVWGILMDADAPGSGPFSGSAVRFVYHVDPPNRFWPKKTLKPY